MSATYRGHAAAPGIGIGLAVLHRSGHFTLEDTQVVGERNPDIEWSRFLSAQRQVDAELEGLGNASNTLVAEVFAAHRMILQDETLLESVQKAIFAGGQTAAAATHQTVSELAEVFSGLEDDYFAGRTADILDIGQRLLVHLGAAPSRSHLGALSENSILVADDLSPTDVAQLEPNRVMGIALAGSTPTAHSAILARSLGIPLVCGLGNRILHLRPHQMAVVDGDRGVLVIDPDATTLRRGYATRQSMIEERASAARRARESALTRDGMRVPVLANANNPEDVVHAVDSGADGIGLLRTEYLFMDRAAPPTVAEQSETYLQFLRMWGGRQLTVRALDAGGDKPVRYVAHPREENPFLGLRGLRLLLAMPELLRSQYRALQIAAHECAFGADLRFMLPMVSSVAEVRTVRELLTDLHTDLPPLKLGVLVEVPSAALLAHRLAPLVDFFSVGTNDLAQYTLASDRTHLTVGVMAHPLHPAVLRLIEMTCVAGRAAGIPVSTCGELSGDVQATPLLLGLGLTEISAPLPAVALVKDMVRRSSMERCRQLAQQALACEDDSAVRALLQAYGS